ncbi:MAG: hypothetical protein GF410_02610, partial [Chitinivibrionales bacterium]|nr:hypothetical protein [Chitinivibrionales bacterium]
MKPAPRLLAILFVGAFVSAFAQLNLNTISSASVREWKYVPTKVETVLVETEVGNGLAKTTLTMVLQPGAYQDYRYDPVEICDDSGCYTSSRRVWYGPEEEVDSIEISSRFTVPTDFVAKEMWLWVDGQKQRAYIQDLALATAQYESTVNRRKDPALLRCHGNGSYDLRIFPAESFKARKIAVEFNHTFNDDSASLITAAIPLAFDSAYSYYYASSKNASIGYMKARIIATDGGSYEFDMPGLGSGTVSSRPLVLEKENIVTLSPGSVYTSDPSGSNEYLWTGKDKDNNLAAGFSYMISQATVDLEPEPETRVIVLDVREEHWDQGEYYEALYEYQYGRTYDYWKDVEPVNVWERAQKYAVLCIKNYVNDGQKFNVVINEEPVFNSPVSPTTSNLVKAFTAIAAAGPDAGTSTLDAMREAADQAGDDVIILISDLMRPYNYVKYLYDSNDRYTGTEKSSAGTAFDELIDSLSERIEKSEATLFTIDDEYSLSAIANESGGYRLASLRDTYYYYRYQPYVVDGEQKYVPALPKLFLDEYYGRGITGVEVTCSQVDNLVYTLDGHQYFWWWWAEPVALDDAVAPGGAVLRKRSAMVLPRYATGERLLRVAAFANPGQNLTFTITGKMGGLKFSKTVKGTAGGSYGTPDEN